MKIKTKDRVNFINLFFKKYNKLFINWELLYDKDNSDYDDHLYLKLDELLDFDQKISLIKNELNKNKFLSKEVSESFLDFLINFLKYNQKEDYDYNEEMKLLNKYWKFINNFKNSNLDFNKSIIYLNNCFYEKQIGFKKGKLK